MKETNVSIIYLGVICKTRKKYNEIMHYLQGPTDLEETKYPDLAFAFDR